MRALWVTALALSACGYTLVRGDRPFGAGSIMLVPFREDAAIGISPALSEKLAAGLTAQGVRVVREESLADAVLSGQVLDETWRLSPGSRAQAYQVTLRVRAELVGKDGTSLWENEVVVNDDFLTVTGDELDLLATESNRRLALARIVNRVAAELLEQMTLAGSLGAS
ncbi:MAG: hypothetical protein HYZ27_11325 [Deltaproteobacteria bacterium]|nr:hypothetical protein [Deltaproteobacteria bacterium]